MPALAAREILLRGGYVHGRKMLGFLVCCIALAISAVYELIEWWAALALGQGAEEFLGTQGDPWDTQSDMFCALLGALIDECTQRGYRQMVAVIGDSQNAGSINLHRSLGFVDAGVGKSFGYKAGRWVDVVFMQRALGKGDGDLTE